MYERFDNMVHWLYEKQDPRNCKNAISISVSKVCFLVKILAKCSISKRNRNCKRRESNRKRKLNIPSVIGSWILIFDQKQGHLTSKTEASHSIDLVLVPVKRHELIAPKWSSWMPPFHFLQNVSIQSRCL